jgi:hypothetical protein
MQLQTINIGCISIVYELLHRTYYIKAFLILTNLPVRKGKSASAFRMKDSAPHSFSGNFCHMERQTKKPWIGKGY